MQAQMNTIRANLMETLMQEFNGHSVYGLELILDELYDKMRHESAKKGRDKVDWFGFSDLSL